MKTRIQWLSKKFIDVKRYPYGFSRSGDFTISQSTQLENKGLLIKALLSNEVSDPTAEDLALKKAIHENDKNHSELAALWLKYSHINNEKISVSSSSHPDGESTDDDWVDDEDIE